MPGSEIIGGPAGSGIIGGPGVLYGARERYSAIAAGLLGTSRLAVLFDHFQQANNGAAQPAMYTASNVGTGAIAMTVAGETTGQGYMQLSTGATAASQAAVINAATVNYPQSRPWYMATRFRLTTVPDAQAQLGIYTSDTSTFRTIGAFACPAIRAANFCLQHSGALAGSSIDLGVPFDTAYHVVEWWGNGGTALNARIDGAAALSAVMTLLGTAAGQVAAIAKNGTTAANQSVIIDWLLSAGAE
jgi:hypothetical protein